MPYIPRLNPYLYPPKADNKPGPKEQAVHSDITRETELFSARLEGVKIALHIVEQLFDLNPKA